MFISMADRVDEPPQSEPGSATPETSISDLMLAVCPPEPGNHAIVIARHTLEPVLALWRSGCGAVASHALGAPCGHLDGASLAWIVDAHTTAEIDSAVHRASHCLGAKGCIVLDVTALDHPPAVVKILKSLSAVGFRLKSVLRRDHRAILIAARKPALAVAA